MYQSFRTELNPNNRQKTLFLQHAGAARWAYNWGLTRKKESYTLTGKSPNAIDLEKELIKRKHSDLPWLKNVSKHAPKEAFRDLDNAYKHFFRRVKLKKAGANVQVGFPKYKKRSRGIGGFRLYGKICCTGKSIHLPKIGWVHLKEYDYLPTQEKLLSATIKEQAGHWYVSVKIKVPDVVPTPATGPVLGIDLGITALATCSDGTTIKNPRALKRNIKKLKRLSRELSRRRRPKGTASSANYKKTKIKLAKHHRRIGNIREDVLQKATSQLVGVYREPHERPSTISIEDLHIAGMLKNHKLARAISNVGMGRFRVLLENKAQLHGVEIHVVSRWYPSSKTYSECGSIKDNLTLKDRIYGCDICYFTIDRDLNAAINLANLARTVSLPGTYTPVESMSDLSNQATLAEAGTEQHVYDNVSIYV